MLNPSDNHPHPWLREEWLEYRRAGGAQNFPTYLKTRTNPRHTGATTQSAAGESPTSECARSPVQAGSPNLSQNPTSLATQQLLVVSSLATDLFWRKCAQLARRLLGALKSNLRIGLPNLRPSGKHSSVENWRRIFALHREAKQTNQTTSRLDYVRGVALRPKI